MILDVGCGSNFHGDVNVDLYPKDYLNHRNVSGDSLIVREIPNFVVADGCFLPFRDRVFDKVLSFQTIEHCATPFRFLGELVRVVKVMCRVVVETVDKYGELLDRSGKRWYQLHHVSKFTRRWFVDAGRLLGVGLVGTCVISYLHVPFRWFGFCLPFEFRVVYVRLR